MSTDVKLLPFNDTQEGDLRRLERDGWIHVRDLCRNYARANMTELLAENERLAEALRKVLAHTGHTKVLPEQIHVDLLASIERIARAALDQEGGK